MGSVYFDKGHSKIVEQFVPTSGAKIFSSNYEFMIFAAMVGRHAHNTCDDVKNNKSGKEIKDHYFGDKESIAYLLALDNTKDGEIMRAGNEDKIWDYFEKYAYLGCEEISIWASDSPIDDLYDVVLEKIMEAAIPLAQSEKKSEIDLS